MQGNGVTLGGAGERHGVEFEGAGVIGRASFWCLCRDEGSCCEGGEDDCVLHVELFGRLMSWECEVCLEGDANGENRGELKD